MSIEYSKINLGKLFGGYIASINYSLGVGNQANSCTLTIISEDNTFEDPKFNEIINIPPFSLSMKVVGFTIRDEINKKILQVELIEQISEILDKQLVCIYGVHTDPYLNIQNESYFDTKSIYIDRSQWSRDSFPSESRFNPSIRPADQLALGQIKKFGDGINVIGRTRITYSKRGFAPTSVYEGSGVLPSDSQIAVYEGGFIKKSLSSFYEKDFEKWTSDKDSTANVKFGYTLFDLKKLFESYGLSFNDLKSQKSQKNTIGNQAANQNSTQGSSAIMNNTSMFFSESGTFRSALSSCLGKIGRTFYIDPFSQEIKIISNSDISKINSNLNSKYSDGVNIEGATQKSITKSISDIDAKHVMLKGIFEEQKINNGFEGSNDPASRRSTFYKFQNLDRIVSFSTEDIRLFSYIAPFSSFLSANTELLFNSYVLGLKLLYGFENSKIYGSDKARVEEFTEIGESEEWETVLRAELKKTDNSFLGSFYDFYRTIGAYKVIRQDPTFSPSDIQGISPDDTDLLEISTAYANVRLGLWFSRPSTFERLKDRSFQNIAGASFGKDLGSLQSLDVSVAALSDPISTVDSLSDLSKLVSFSGKNPSKIKVRDIIPKAGEGVATHVAIARRSLFPQISDIQANNFNLPILENALPAILGKQENIYFLITNSFQSIMQSLTKKASIILSKEVEDRTPSQIIVNYIKVENREGFDSPEPPENDINLEQKSVSLEKSKVKNFLSRSMNVTEENVFQIKVLKDNIQDIIPEFDGPSIKVSIDYFRPPKKEDLNVEDGVNSLSISMSPDGITTSVTYSSIRYKEIDFNLISETYGFKEGLIIDKPEALPAFKRK